MQAVRDRDNQALAAEVSVLTTMTMDEIQEVVQKLCADHNIKADQALIREQTQGGRLARWAAKDQNPKLRHLHLMERQGEILISYSVTPQRILEKGFNPVDHTWIARLRAVQTSTDSKAEHAASISLLRWTVDGSGYIWHGDKYKQLRDRLLEGVGGAASTIVAPWREVTIGEMTYRTLAELETARTKGRVSASDYRSARTKLKGDDATMRSIG